MELRTLGIDRVLEALAPTLSAEIERMLQEKQQSLELEFQKRLQGAVRDSEAATQRLAEVQREEAVQSASDNVRRQTTEELQAQFRKTLQDATDKLQTEFATERKRLAEQLDEWRLFADAQRQLVEAGSQTEILVRFLKLAERFAPSIAVYIAKSDGLALWKARGDAAFPPIVSQGTIDPEWFFRQINVREKLVAAVCAIQPFRVDAVNFLAACLERSIESFGLRLRIPVPKAAPPEPTPVEIADEKMHAEARQMARLLVSEIKLYNEQAVRDGRSNGDLYQSMQNEIESGREQYRQRVAPGVLSTSDYFHEEIVRILADNDVSRLGDRYPGPSNS